MYAAPDTSMKIVVDTQAPIRASCENVANSSAAIPTKRAENAAVEILVYLSSEAVYLMAVTYMSVLPKYK